MSSGSIYSASDKALFDAINQSSVTASDLRELFLRHGIVIATGTPRRQLALHFARLSHDYDDFETLARIFESPKRRERMAPTRISGNVGLEDIEAAAHAVVSSLIENNDAATVTVHQNGSSTSDINSFILIRVSSVRSKSKKRLSRLNKTATHLCCVALKMKR